MSTAHTCSSSSMQPLMVLPQAASSFEKVCRPVSVALLWHGSGVSSICLVNGWHWKSLLLSGITAYALSLIQASRIQLGLAMRADTGGIAAGTTPRLLQRWLLSCQAMALTAGMSETSSSGCEVVDVAGSVT